MSFLKKLLYKLINIFLLNVNKIIMIINYYRIITIIKIYLKNTFIITFKLNKK